MESKSNYASDFSSDGKLFALIDDHGILKIWDTETSELKQEFTPNLHLAAPCTCLTWVTASQASPKDRNKKRRKSMQNDCEVEQLYIALGTSTGGVTMYSYNTSKVEIYMKEGHAGRVNNIIYDGGNLLYTCGDDRKIIAWNISEKVKIASWSVGKEKPNNICIPASDKILVGARQLHLYSPQTQNLLQTFVGHTSAVTLFSSFSYNGVDYVLSASKMERIVCLWTLTVKNKHKNATCSFLMEDIATCLSCCVDEEGILKIAAVTRSGVIHFYMNNLEKVRPEKPIKPSVTIQVTSDDSGVITPVPAVTVSLKFALTQNDILYAYGDRHFLRFEHITPNFTEKLQVLIRDDPKNSRLNSAKQQHENLIKNVTPVINANNVEYTTGITAIKKKMKTDQIPMETRLHNLHLEKGEVPQAQSKVQLLIQALHSKDESLLMQVLSSNNSKVIHLTLQKLPLQYIGSLVNELTLLMQKKRKNVQYASNWIQTLVKIHSSQLMALGANDLLEKFGPCLGIIEHRTNCLAELSKLNGRLNLLVNQIRRNTEEELLNNENVIVYEDEDSTNSDFDDDQPGTKASSEDEWEEMVSDEEIDVAKDD